MWWFLVVTFGSVTPAYVAPMGPFPSLEVCQDVRLGLIAAVEQHKGTIDPSGCWKSDEKSNKGYPVIKPKEEQIFGTHGDRGEK
jgi:hypothetical protein